MAIFDSKPLVYKHIPLVVSTVHPLPDRPVRHAWKGTHGASLILGIQGVDEMSMFYSGWWF